MCPCRATRAGTQAPPLPFSIIFFHAIPHKLNNHLHAILSNDINRPHAIHQTNKTTHAQSTKRNRRGGACVPARTSAQRRFHTKNHISCVGMNNGCALAGRHGRAHRHRPYPSQPTTRGVPLSHHIVHSIAHAKPHGVFIPHRIAHSIAPNRTVCHYPIGVILSIVQGWQV